MKLIKPPALKKGDILGIFAPSSAAHVWAREKYQMGLENLRRQGFETREGPLTATAQSQGYRAGTPQERANEFMELVRDPKVKGLVAVIGGSNSSSLIPYLDFDAIRAHPKVVCGYSDVTSLHLSILRYSGLSTFYGPAVVPSWGEWPEPLAETVASFLSAVTDADTATRRLEPPKRWSHHKRSWASEAWKTEAREYETNPGWLALRPGQVSAPVVVANLNTLVAAAGTPYFPDLAGKILFIEEMDAPISKEERSFRQLERMGVFDAIEGLLMGKPEVYNGEGAPFTLDELLLEVVGSKRKFPIVTNIDCGHTHPMLTLAEMTRITIMSHKDYDTSITVDEPMVAPRTAVNE